MDQNSAMAHQLGLELAQELAAEMAWNLVSRMVPLSGVYLVLLLVAVSLGLPVKLWRPECVSFLVFN